MLHCAQDSSESCGRFNFVATREALHTASKLVRRVVLQSSGSMYDLPLSEVGMVVSCGVQEKKRLTSDYHSPR